MHLFLAFFWFIVGAGILAAPLLLSGNGALQFDGSTRVPVGVFALFLCGYNVLRWRLARLRKRYAQEVASTPTARPRRDEPPNPDFDFSKPETPGGDGGRPA